jgi:S-adenosylmethionine hydrolase
VPGAPPAPAVHFLSDYGLVDEFVGVVHAVVHRGAPGVPVIDLTHQVPAFDVAAGAATLLRCAPFLGPGVVLAVVDPGVATDRRAVAVQVGPAPAAGRPGWLVGPDNGLLVPLAEALGGPVAALALGAPGSTFDGRDVFGPAAAHLVTGGEPEAVGIPVAVGSLVPAPAVVPDRVEGGALVTTVGHVDGFGNVGLRARPDALAALGLGVGDTVAVALGASAPTPARWVVGFADLGPGELGLLVDADGRLALVLDRRPAAARLGTGAAAGHAPEVRLGPAG